MASGNERGLTWTAANAATHDSDPASSAGLFVGVRQFTEVQSFGELRFAVDDAIDLAHMVSLDLGLLEPEKVCLALSGEPSKPASASRLAEMIEARSRCIEATQEEILRQLGPLLDSAGSGGIFWLTFATHGFDSQGEQFLATGSSVRAFLRESGIPLRRLLDRVNRAAAERRLILIDACRETLPGARSLALPDIPEAAGQIVLYGTRAGGLSFEDAELQNGVFTAAILDGLRGEAPPDRHGYITANSLADYVNQRVAHWMRQNHPSLAGPGVGIAREIDGPAGHIRLAASAYHRRRDAALQNLRLHLDAPLTGRVFDLVQARLGAGGPSTDRLNLVAELEALDDSLTSKRSLLYYLQNETPPRPDLEEQFRPAFELATGVSGCVDYRESQRMMSQLASEGNVLARVWIATARTSGLFGFEREPAARRSVEQSDLAAVQELAVAGSAVAATIFAYAVHDGFIEEASPSDAVRWIRQAAEQGEPTGMNFLGFLHHAGEGVTKDLAEANRWFHRAAAMGLPAAISNIGWAFRRGDLSEPDLEEARRWFERGARMKHPPSIRFLAELHRDGVGVARDPHEALRLFRKAAELGEGEAWADLAFLHLGKQGLEADLEQAVHYAQTGAEAGNATSIRLLGAIRADAEDYREALYWWSRGAEYGDAGAMELLAQLHDQGLGVEPSPEQAFRWRLRASELGDREAMATLGSHYWEGLGVEPDRSEALAWWRRAAELGDKSAMTIIGARSWFGDGVEEDPALAVVWWRRAVELGSVESANLLGMAYLEGRGVEQSGDRAFELLSRAAEGGSTYAMSNLGTMFHLGRGVPPDRQKAAHWFQRAHEAGHPTALDQLAALEARVPGEPLNVQQKDPLHFGRPRPAHAVTGGPGKKPSFWSQLARSLFDS